MDNFFLMLMAEYEGDEEAYEKYKRLLKRERIIKIIITVVCLLVAAASIVAIVAYISYDNKVRNYCKLELSPDKTHYVVTGYDGEDVQVTIPSVYRGKPIMSIGERAFCDNSSIESVAIPDSVINIENGAFAGCTALTDVIIPDSVARIGDYAFYNCSSLVAITLPASITNIGAYVFENCGSFYKIDFEGTSAQWEAITKGESWDGDSWFYVVYCSDTIIMYSN